MKILMLGVNHRTAGLSLRERIALYSEKLDRIFGDLQALFPAAELVVLSTCNRTEFYLADPEDKRSENTPATTDQIIAFLASATGVDPGELAEVAVIHEDDEAVRHLFNVAAGLDSMVLGEAQILGQVRRAYQYANRRSATGPFLNKTFQTAIATAKQVRTQTGIGEGRVSVGSVAVDFARQIFERFEDKTIVAIGAGEIVKLMLRHLLTLNPAKLWVTNRTFERAEHLVQMLGISTEQGAARPFEHLDDLLVEADIVLTSTGAPMPIITGERFKPLRRRRKRRPLYLIDIALPRDVETSVGDLNDVYLYNLDHLQDVVTQSHAQRSNEVGQCEAMLAESVRVCMHEIRHRDVGQMIKALRHKLHEIGRTEQGRTVQKIASAAPKEVPRLIEEHSHRLINKVLHLPMKALDRREPDARLDDDASALRRLFGLDDSARP